jgi:hypothetical protein
MTKNAIHSSLAALGIVRHRTWRASILKTSGNVDLRRYSVFVVAQSSKMYPAAPAEYALARGQGLELAQRKEGTAALCGARKEG